MLHTKFRRNVPAGSGEEDFLMFLPYMGMTAILVIDLDHLYKLSFPLPKEAPHKIWLRLAKGFQRRRHLKMVDDDNDNNDDGRRSMGLL